MSTDPSQIFNEHYQNQVTFMYFDDLKAARIFFESLLNLPTAFDPGWAIVYKVAQGAFIGAVDAARGSIQLPHGRGGSLISLTVTDVMPHYERFLAYSKDENPLVTDLSAIKDFEDIGIRSFFFKGPNGYDFEIQQFTSELGAF